MNFFQELINGININGKDVYIVAEIYIRALFRPIFGKHNIVLRYMTEYDQEPPADWSVNYKDNRVACHLIPEDQYDTYVKEVPDMICNENKTRCVLLKGRYHRLWGYQNMQVIDYKDVTQVDPYSIK